MSTTLNIIGFLLGLAAIIKGGDIFVDAAKWISVKLKIPSFIVGATIVSLATALPEILVSCFAAARNSSDLAVGNAIGSVTANTGLVMGISLLFISPAIRRSELIFKGGILLATVSLLCLLPLFGTKGYILTVTESIVLFVLFVIFIAESIHAAHTGTISIERTDASKDSHAFTKNTLKFIFGTLGLALGSKLLVECGRFIAADVLRINEVIVGLTVVAVGTSLPEAVTAVTSMLKKEANMSIGNIIGANIIDTALILPLCSAIKNGALPVQRHVVFIDLPVCLTITALAIIPTVLQGRFMKYQGLLMLICYIAYITYTAVSANIIA